MARRTLATTLFIIAIILVVIGALNWGWIGLTNNNFITSLNNETVKNRNAERVIYILVGIAGLYVLFHLARSWRTYY